MKKRVVILSYGKGGHQEQMNRLLEKLENSVPKDTYFVVISDSTKELSVKRERDIVESFIYDEARDKHSVIKTIFTLPKLFMSQLFDFTRLRSRYEVTGIITTGPGVSILPALLCKMTGVKVIAFESWSRFHTQSYTGKLLYKIADIFFIQNKSLIKHYPNAVYKGRL
ncbi:PssD/Cps14F family polysaccharide biosynthesis glycosyltransferase [Thalassotalea euphylliae]|uniref:Polysaccharide biosynthesis protein n=1 Tax=Thalassotalea euphylliae TaxID=1655234 RepID=A0A3E0U0K2_9GAMM|nr:PssD/Cps14F family polysaccharide biosynthesis glycosyltransferase [Thalassotalea euphylliae]REL30209.1 polysaccharide biosynthesis protein [Thalassotalea euphylliae]